MPRPSTKATTNNQFIVLFNPNVSRTKGNGEVPYPSFTETDYCYDRTKYLKSFSHNIYEPYLVDVISTYTSSGVEVIVILNVYHLDIVSREAEKHRHYLLEYNGKNYSNLFKLFPTVDNYNAFRYLIPLRDIRFRVEKNSSFYFSLFNNIQKRVYRNIKTCVMIPSAVQHSITLCAYATPFNPVEELYNWIAYYQLQNVTKFIIYLGKEYPEMRNALKGYVAKGIVEFVDWSWPIAGVVWTKVPQREHQASHTMSCFYRYRWITKYMIQCDLDEYIFSNMTRYNLEIPIEAAFAHWPKSHVLQVSTDYTCNL